MNVAFVRVLKVKNFPKFTGSSLCGYRVLVHILPKDEGSYGTLEYIQNYQEANQEDYLTSQVTWNFLYDDANTSSIGFSFFYDDFHFANLKLPLFWFQKNSVVRYSFPARLLTNAQLPGNEGMMVKVAIHLSENKEAAFLAPKGNLLVTPKWGKSSSQKNHQQPQSTYYQPRTDVALQQNPPQQSAYNQYPPLTVSQPQTRVTTLQINSQAPQAYEQSQQVQQYNQYQQTQRLQPQDQYQQQQFSYQMNPQELSQQPRIQHSSLSPYSSQDHLPDAMQAQQPQIQHSPLSPNQSINNVSTITQLQQPQIEHYPISPNSSQALPSPSYPSVPLINEINEEKRKKQQLPEYNQQFQQQQQFSEFSQQYQQTPGSFVPTIPSNLKCEPQINQKEEESFSSNDDDGALDNLGFAQDSDDENNDQNYIPQIIQTQPLNQNSNIIPNISIDSQQQQIPPKIKYPPFPTQQFPLVQHPENALPQDSKQQPPQSQPVMQYPTQIEQQSPPQQQPAVQYPSQPQPMTYYPQQPAVQFPPQPQEQPVPPITQYPPQQIPAQSRPPLYVSPYPQYAPPVQPLSPPPPPSYYQYNQRPSYPTYAYQIPPTTFVSSTAIPVGMQPPPPQTGSNVIIQSNRPLNARQQYIVRQPQPHPYPYPIQYPYPYGYRPQYANPVPPPPPQSYYPQPPPSFYPPSTVVTSQTLQIQQQGVQSIRQTLPSTTPKKKQYEITPLPPGTPSKVYIPPPVTFDPSQNYNYQQEEQRKKTKSEKAKNSQKLAISGDHSEQFSLDPSQRSTSMLEDSLSDQSVIQPNQIGDKIISIGNDGFDNNNSLKPLNVPTSNFSAGSLEKSSQNPIIDNQKQSYFLPQYPSE